MTETETATLQTKQIHEPGNIVRFDYTLWIDGEANPIETSRHEVAVLANILRQGRNYKPALAMLGAGHLIEGLDGHIRFFGAVGEKQTVVISPETGYGPRRPPHVVPTAKFGKDAKSLKVGTQVRIGDVAGTVTRMGSGRVTIDSNHDLAGKTLRYEYEVIGSYANGQALAAAMAEMVFDRPCQVDDLKGDGSSLVVEIPPSHFDSQHLPGNKGWIARQLHLRGVAEVVFLESRKAPVAPEQPPIAGATA